jgi:hypothetical protein
VCQPCCLMNQSHCLMSQFFGPRRQELSTLAHNKSLFKSLCRPDI